MDTTTADPILVEGVDPVRLRRALEDGRDDNGDMIEPFTDTDGGWPLRCCLSDSSQGDRIAIIAWSPFEWSSPWRTTGPVVVHVDPCAPVPRHEVPAQFSDRDQVLRAYGHDRRLVYDLNELVRRGDGIGSAVVRILADQRVEFVQSYNVAAGCYSFTARRGLHGWCGQEVSPPGHPAATGFVAQ